MVIIMKKGFNRVIKGFFGWVASFFGGTFKETATSIKAIKEAPFQNSITLTMMAARVAALIMFAYAVGYFIGSGGYGEQISTIREGVSSWSRALTVGTLPLYLGGAVPVIWTILLVLTFFAIHTSFVLNEEGAKRALMVLLMLAVLVSLILFLLFTWGVIYERTAPVADPDALRHDIYIDRSGIGKLRDNIQQSDMPWYVPVIYLAALGFSLAFASIMAMRSGHNKQMKQWLSTVLSLYIGLPLLLWFSQNLLALVAMVALLLVVGGIIYLLFTMLYSKLGDSGETPPPDRPETDSTVPLPAPVPTHVEPGSAARPARASAAATPASYVQVEAGAQLWKDKSDAGYFVYCMNAKGEVADVCSGMDFDKGKVIIMQDKEPISFIPLRQK